MDWPALALWQSSLGYSRLTDLAGDAPVQVGVVMFVCGLRAETVLSGRNVDGAMHCLPAARRDPLPHPTHYPSRISR